MNVLIVDALASNDGKRKFTRDVIGIGPRVLAGICEHKNVYCTITRAETILFKEHNFDLSSFDAFLISGMSVDEIAVKTVIQILKREVMQPRIFLGGPITSDISCITGLNISAAVQGKGELFLEKLIEENFDIRSLLENFSNVFQFQKLEKTYLIRENPSVTYDIFAYYPSTLRIRDYSEYWFARVYVEVVRGCSNFFRGDLVKEQGSCPDCGFCSESELQEVDYIECPANIPPGCGFCSVPSTFGAPISRPRELIVKEVKELFDLGVNRIVLSAPGFLDYMRGENEKVFSASHPPPNIFEIEKLLSELADLRDELPYRSIIVENVKPTLVNKKVADILGKYLPGTPISIGCETFDEELGRKLGRPASPQKTIEASKMLYDAGLKPQIYLIHSLPGETVSALDNTTKTVERELSSIADKVTVYKYLPLPLSPFTQMGVSSPPERFLLRKKREELKEAIISFNREKKKQLIDGVYSVIIAEKDVKRDKTYIGYFINAGPAVSVESDQNILKKIVKVKVTEVLSDKLVKADMLEIVKELNN